MGQRPDRVVQEGKDRRKARHENTTSISRWRLEFFCSPATLKSVIPEDRAMLESNPSAAADAETRRRGTWPEFRPPVCPNLVFWPSSEKLIFDFSDHVSKNGVFTPQLEETRRG